VSALPMHVPPGDTDAKPFWESCARHAMALQRCDACGRFRYPPRPVCPHCTSDRATWTPVAGTGTVYVQLGVYPRVTAPSNDAPPEPFSLTMIELDEGVRMWSNVLAAPDAVRIGDRVRITYADVEGGTLPRFTLENAIPDADR
jgi:uncharacterized OB-fold protein